MPWRCRPGPRKRPRNPESLWPVDEPGPPVAYNGMQPLILSIDNLFPYVLHRPSRRLDWPGPAAMTAQAPGAVETMGEMVVEFEAKLKAEHGE